MSNMFEIIGASNPAYLLADPNGASVIAIPVKPGQGIISRGTILYRAANGMYVKASASEITDSYSLVVLDESVNTDTNPGVAEDARAYRGGRFIYGKVLLGSSAEIAANYQLVLRRQGILFDRMADGVEFENGNYSVTYMPNNEVTTDKPVTKAKEPNVAYTILNNSDSSLSFTAPSTKSFSKWNTAADGSGTDYAAAASYTKNADLTLYAVWA